MILVHFNYQVLKSFLVIFRSFLGVNIELLYVSSFLVSFQIVSNVELKIVKLK